MKIFWKFLKIFWKFLKLIVLRFFCFCFTDGRCFSITFLGLKGEVESAKQAVELQRGTVSAKEHETQTRLNQLAQQHAKEIALADQEKSVDMSFSANLMLEIKKINRK